jgi:TPR repeat protein
VNDIGKIYENGWGVAKDESIANEWYQKAKAKAALSAEVHEE